MDLSGGLLVAVRTIHLMSSALVAGGLLFANVVAEPAFRATVDSGSLLANRFRRDAVRLVFGALVLALVSGAAWLVLLAQRIGDQPPSAALTETTWTLLTQTQFGTVWQLRLACAIVLGALLFALTRQGLKRSNVVLGAAVSVGAFFVGTLAWSGHGGATPGTAGYIHIAADILHLIAAAAWVGGLVPLVMLVRLQFRVLDDCNGVVTTNALYRFSNLGVVSVAIILATGVVNLSVVVGGVDGLSDSSYGRLLAFKIALFLGMLGFAAVNRIWLMPQLASGGAAATEQSSRVLHRIRHNAIAEIGIGAVIFIIVGFLGLMAPVAHPHVHM